MYVVAAFKDGFNRNRKGTHIEQLFLTLFHTNIKSNRRIFRFTAQQYQTAIYFSKYNREHFDCSTCLLSY